MAIMEPNTLADKLPVAQIGTINVFYLDSSLRWNDRHLWLLWHEKLRRIFALFWTSVNADQKIWLKISFFKGEFL